VEPRFELDEELDDELSLLVEEEVEVVEVELSVVPAAEAAWVPGLLAAATQLNPTVAETPRKVAPAVRARSRSIARLRSAGVSRCAVFMVPVSRMEPFGPVTCGG